MKRLRSGTILVLSSLFACAIPSQSRQAWAAQLSAKQPVPAASTVSGRAPGTAATPSASAAASAQPSPEANGEASEANAVAPEHPNTKAGMRLGAAEDSFETTATLPARTLEITAIDPQAAPAPGVAIELSRERQSVSEGNSTTKWQGTTDAAGRVRFDDLPVSSDSQYRIVAVSGQHRYGTRPFRVDSKSGTKVVFHVYPIVNQLKESLIAGRTFVFLEPRDDVLAVEVMAEFHNLGQTVLTAEVMSLTLPVGWKAFATNPTDPDLAVAKHDAGVALTGSIAPGQHSVSFSYQIASENRARLELDLNLWPNTAEAQIATLSRPGLELQVDGFPNATVVRGNGRQPLLMTGKSFTHDQGPPQALRLEIAGLPVIGPGRWYAVFGAGALVLSALLTFGVRRRGGATTSHDDRMHRDARKRIVQELAALMRAKQEGQVGPETYASTRETLLGALVRIERRLENN
jgi:hypothetical protein